MYVALMGLGVLGLLSSLLWGEWPGLLGVLSLVGWIAGQALCLAWDAIKVDRKLAASILGEQSFRKSIPAHAMLSHVVQNTVVSSLMQQVAAQHPKWYACLW